MKYPKLVIATDGRHTGALLDGVFIGSGIRRLDFSTENEDGKMKGSIRILDLDIDSVTLDRGTAEFEDFIGKLADKG